MSFSSISIVFLVFIIHPSVASGGFRFIDECIFGNEGKLTFICYERSSSTDNTKGIYCSNFKIPFSSLVKFINFETCELKTMPQNIFSHYYNVVEFDASNTGLTEVSHFRNVSKQLKKLIASHNNITEVPSHLFNTAASIETIDFSFNRIKQINLDAFQNGFYGLGVIHLNLSHNEIKILEKDTLKHLDELVVLDISWNEINMLMPKAFQHFRKLQHLDLSGNPIKMIDDDIFSNLIAVQHLNLSHTSLKQIHTEAFLALVKLQTLDLSNNQLKNLDASVYPQHSEHMRWLSIANNQLETIDGFMSDLVSNVIITGSESNNFDCNYLNTYIRINSTKCSATEAIVSSEITEAPFKLSSETTEVPIEMDVAPQVDEEFPENNSLPLSQDLDLGDNDHHSKESSNNDIVSDFIRKDRFIFMLPIFIVICIGIILAIVWQTSRQFNKKASSTQKDEDEDDLSEQSCDV